MLGELERAKAELVRLAAADGEPGVAALVQLVAFERNRGHDEAAAAFLARAVTMPCSREQMFAIHVHEAELASRANRADDAFGALARAEALAEGMPRAAVLRLWVNEGAVRIRLDRPAEARTWLLRALELAESLGGQESAANCMLNLSLVCQEDGLSDESLLWAGRAVERSALVGAERPLVFSLLHLVTLHIDALRLDDAEAALARLGACLDRLDSDEARYNRHAREAELSLVRRQFQRSLDSAERGLALAAAHPRNEAALRVLRAQALLGLDRTAEALDEARCARATLAALGADGDAEEALAVAARAQRRLGADGAERRELRALSAPCSFAAALEKALADGDEGERGRWRAAAAHLATHARWKAELDAREA